jgi:hypothetical protein
MRKLAIALLVVCTTASALAQGTINFNNRLDAANWAKVTDADGVTGLAGTGFNAQLFAGPAGTAADALTAVVASLVTFRTGAGAGSWVAVNGMVIPNVAPGAQAALQVRAWANNGGALTSYAAAVAAGAPNGVSAVFTSNPLGGFGTPPSTPPQIVGPGVTDPMTGFSLVPEPSVIALGALGALALVLRRRKA